jgi:hypothetical protein
VSDAHINASASSSSHDQPVPVGGVKQWADSDQSTMEVFPGSEKT